MIWQYSADSDGAIVSAAITPLLNAVQNGDGGSGGTGGGDGGDGSNSGGDGSSGGGDGSSGGGDGSSDGGNTGPSANAEVIRFGYVNRINEWSSGAGIARSIGVPGYAPDTLYNYICLTFWLSAGPADAALVWQNPVAYIGASEFGSTN